MPCPVRIAIVDDLPLYRRSLRFALKSYPQIEVVAEAENGQEAIEVACAHQPDVMLMDVSMPVMNGIEACRHITRKCPDVRVLVLTMHANGMEFQAIEAGACYCLGKETRVVELVGKIQTCNRIGEA